MSSVFLVVRIDAANSAKKREAVMDAHIDYTITNKHRFYIGGAIRHDANAAALGSAMLIKAVNLEDAQKFAALDPFDQAGVYKRTNVWLFNAGIGEWLPAEMQKL